MTIHEGEESRRSGFSALDGLFQRHAPHHGSGRYGGKGDHTLCGRDSAAFSLLYSRLRGGVMVLLDVSPEQVEPAEDSVRGADGDDGASFGGACEPGLDESVSGDIVSQQ